jgi:hypothetical protein
MLNNYNYNIKDSLSICNKKCSKNSLLKLNSSKKRAIITRLAAASMVICAQLPSMTILRVMQSPSKTWHRTYHLLTILRIICLVKHPVVLLPTQDFDRCQPRVEHLPIAVFVCQERQDKTQIPQLVSPMKRVRVRSKEEKGMGKSL